MVGLWFGGEICRGLGFCNKDVMERGGSLANASCIDGKECRCEDGVSLSSSIVLRVSVGDMYPPLLTTALAVDSYGGGGPDHMDGLTSGAGMFKAAETGSL